jgi:hypothetical protein
MRGQKYIWNFGGEAFWNTKKEMWKNITMNLKKMSHEELRWTELVKFVSATTASVSQSSSSGDKVGPINGLFWPHDISV